MMARRPARACWDLAFQQAAEVERLKDIVKRWSPIVLKVDSQKCKHAASKPGRPVKVDRKPASEDRQRQRQHADKDWGLADKFKNMKAKAKKDEPPT